MIKHLKNYSSTLGNIFIKNMVNYKLFYFNVTGLAEPIRYMLHYCGVKFEDIRFENFEEWKINYKKDMPMEQVPVLEIDGTKYHQHIPICRYIAKKFNIYGSNEEESLKMDALVDDMKDMRIEIGMYYKEENPVFKQILKERMMKNIPFFLNKFETQLIKNNGYFFDGKLSWVDIYYAGICEVSSNIIGYDINRNHPNLRRLTENVRNNEKIQKYIEKRPTTSL